MSAPRDTTRGDFAFYAVLWLLTADPAYLAYTTRNPYVKEATAGFAALAFVLWGLVLLCISLDLRDQRRARRS